MLEDTVFDREQNKYLPRRLTLSGSDRYGLPTSKDDDVLLACIQLSRLNDFATREVSFSRYEILRLLGWADESRNYERVATSLRRWKGLSIYSDRAFYDHEQKSWVNRDFGVFDNLVIYRREVIQGKAAPGCSRFVWNEVLFRSFQSGYLKQLDWNLYCRLTSPVAKRLYRFLDKRFYHSSRVEIDLLELGLRKVRLAANNNTAQMKRSLLKGIEELEHVWELKPRLPEERFRKDGRRQMDRHLRTPSQTQPHNHCTLRRHQRSPQSPRRRLFNPPSTHRIWNANWSNAASALHPLRNCHCRNHQTEFARCWNSTTGTTAEANLAAPDFWCNPSGIHPPSRYHPASKVPSSDKNASRPKKPKNRQRPTFAPNENVWHSENRIPDSGRLWRSGKPCHRANRTPLKPKLWKPPTP